MSDALDRLQTQSEILAELPATIAELQTVVAGLADLSAATREAMESVHRISRRIEAVADDIEEPLRALRPGIERLAIGLDDPVVERVPQILLAIERAVLPISSVVQRVLAKWRTVTVVCGALSSRLTALVRRRSSLG